MFLLARALDAASPTPCMGLLCDRTHSRWGKFRPWVLFGARCRLVSFVCAALRHAGSQSERQNDLCRHHHTLLTRFWPRCGQHHLLRVGGVTNDPNAAYLLQSTALYCWQRRAECFLP